MNKKIQVTVTLERHTAEFISTVSEQTGTPINELVSAIVNGYRVQM